MTRPAPVSMTRHIPIHFKPLDIRYRFDNDYEGDSDSGDDGYHSRATSMQKPKKQWKLEPRKRKRPPPQDRQDRRKEGQEERHQQLKQHRQQKPGKNRPTILSPSPPVTKATTVTAAPKTTTATTTTAATTEETTLAVTTATAADGATTLGSRQIHGTRSTKSRRRRYGESALERKLRRQSKRVEKKSASIDPLMQDMEGMEISLVVEDAREDEKKTSSSRSKARRKDGKDRNDRKHESSDMENADKERMEHANQHDYDDGTPEKEFDDWFDHDYNADDNDDGDHGDDGNNRNLDDYGKEAFIEDSTAFNDAVGNNSSNRRGRREKLNTRNLELDDADDVEMHRIREHRDGIEGGIEFDCGENKDEVGEEEQEEDSDEAEEVVTEVEEDGMEKEAEMEGGKDSDDGSLDDVSDSTDSAPLRICSSKSKNRAKNRRYILDDEDDDDDSGEEDDGDDESSVESHDIRKRRGKTANKGNSKVNHGASRARKSKKGHVESDDEVGDPTKDQPQCSTIKKKSLVNPKNASKKEMNHTEESAGTSQKKKTTSNNNGNRNEKPTPIPMKRSSTIDRTQAKLIAKSAIATSSYVAEAYAKAAATLAHKNKSRSINAGTSKITPCKTLKSNENKAKTGNASKSSSRCKYQDWKPPRSRKKKSAVNVSKPKNQQPYSQFEFDEPFGENAKENAVPNREENVDCDGDDDDEDGESQNNANKNDGCDVGCGDVDSDEDDEASEYQPTQGDNPSHHPIHRNLRCSLDKPDVVPEPSSRPVRRTRSSSRSSMNGKWSPEKIPKSEENDVTVKEVDRAGPEKKESFRKRKIHHEFLAEVTESRKRQSTRKKVNANEMALQQSDSNHCEDDDLPCTDAESDSSKRNAKRTKHSKQHQEVEKQRESVAKKSQNNCRMNDAHRNECTDVELREKAKNRKNEISKKDSKAMKNNVKDEADESAGDDYPEKDQDDGDSNAEASSDDEASEHHVSKSERYSSAFQLSSSRTHCRSRNTMENSDKKDGRETHQTGVSNVDSKTGMKNVGSRNVVSNNQLNSMRKNDVRHEEKLSRRRAGTEVNHIITKLKLEVLSSDDDEERRTINGNSDIWRHPSSQPQLSCSKANTRDDSNYFLEEEESSVDNEVYQNSGDRARANAGLSQVFTQYSAQEEEGSEEKNEIRRAARNHSRVYTQFSSPSNVTSDAEDGSNAEADEKGAPDITEQSHEETIHKEHRSPESRNTNALPMKEIPPSDSMRVENDVPFEVPEWKKEDDAEDSSVAYVEFNMRDISTLDPERFLAAIYPENNDSSESSTRSPSTTNSRSFKHANLSAVSFSDEKPQYQEETLGSSQYPDGVDGVGRHLILPGSGNIKLLKVEQRSRDGETADVDKAELFRQFLELRGEMNQANERMDFLLTQLRQLLQKDDQC